MKLMILYDIKGWAYYHEAIGLQKYLRQNKIDASIENYPKFYGKYSESQKKKYDLVFLYPRQARPLTYPPQKTITKFSSFGDFSKQKDLNSDNFIKFVCTNKQILEKAITQLPHRKNKIVYIPLAIDTEIFTNTPLEKRAKLTFAFAGNHKRRGKGYDIISQSIKNAGNKINFKQALAGPNKLSYHQMNDFYNSIDVIICMSSAEGGPLTGFEGGACGVPMICGCKKSAIWEVTKNNKDCFKIERTEKALTKKILELVENPELVKITSNNIYTTIKKYHSWKNVIKIYIKLFNEVINEVV